MITCKLCGGLGNQLFQIFTTIAYALKYSKPFFFLNNRQLGNGINGSTIRYTYWESFLNSLKPFLKNINEIPELMIIKEKDFTYSELPENLNKYMGSLLVGYFQSPRYFEQYKESICKLLKIEQKKLVVKNKVSVNFENLITISIHFRFGDYKNYPNIYPLLDEIYYINALNEIMEELYVINNKKQYLVLYFCEEDSLKDVESIVENLKISFPKISFQRVDSKIEDWEQMILMSLCEHNIIANSTFSWWGAYLNMNIGKKVCYPEQWFLNKNASDLFPDDWIPISIT